RREDFDRRFKNRSIVRGTNRHEQSAPDADSLERAASGEQCGIELGECGVRFASQWVGRRAVHERDRGGEPVHQRDHRGSEVFPVKGWIGGKRNTKLQTPNSREPPSTK